MWHIEYDLAVEIAVERLREARLARLAHEVRARDRTSILSLARRSGALLAARIARGLDECVAQEAVARSARD
jgi:hypothetical protein